MSQWIRAVMMLILIYHLLLAPAHAVPKTLTFCAEQYQPYAIKNSQGIIDSGVTYDIMKKALEELGYKLAVEEVNYAYRCFVLSRSGEISGAFFTTEAGKNKKMYYLDKPLEYWTLNVMVPQDSPFKEYTSLTQFDGKHIGFTKDYGYPEKIKQNKKWLVEEENEVILNLRKLSAKRIDLYIDDPYQAAAMIKRENLKVRILYPSVDLVPTFVEIKDRLLHRKLNKKINELFVRGYVDQVYQKYTGKTFKDFLKGPNP
ncbi:MAG: transporter substrate-binding domain-containing protein [Bdellovibrionales bacterium]|nr:transporter substrate-binding domain-containing protein [Bdellovibrionales bacterium]